MSQMQEDAKRKRTPTNFAGRPAPAVVLNVGDEVRAAVSGRLDNFWKGRIVRVNEHDGTYDVDINGEDNVVEGLPPEHIRDKNGQVPARPIPPVLPGHVVMAPPPPKPASKVVTVSRDRAGGARAKEPVPVDVDGVDVFEYLGIEGLTVQPPGDGQGDLADRMLFEMHYTASKGGEEQTTKVSLRTMVNSDTYMHLIDLVDWMKLLAISTMQPGEFDEVFQGEDPGGSACAEDDSRRARQLELHHACAACQYCTNAARLAAPELAHELEAEAEAEAEAGAGEQ